jgi:hypothetical protein
MPRQSTPSAVATIGIDIGKNTFHLVGLDQRGAIALQLKSSREQLERRLANLPRCLIGMEACSGAHHWEAAPSPRSRRAANSGSVREAVPQGAYAILLRTAGPHLARLGLRAMSVDRTPFRPDR